MFPTINIGPAAFPVSGLVVLAGIWIGLLLAERSCERRGVSPSDLNNLVLLAAVSGLIGARIGFVIENTELFFPNPLSALSLRPIFLDPFVGIVAALLATGIYIQRKQLHLWEVLDSVTPLFAVLMISTGMANLSSGSAFGTPTTVPWGINLWGEIRHPTQIYSLLSAIVVLVLIFPRWGPLESQTPGITFLRFTGLTAISVLLIEAFRGDSQLIWSGLRQNQIFAWLILLATLLLLGYLQYFQKKQKGASP